MVRHIQHVTLVLFAAFAAVSGGLVYWQVLRSDSLARDAGNPRVAELASGQNRGRILDRNGEVLADSPLQPNGQRRRAYALPSLAQTIGYVSTRFGVSGLEQSYNAALSGAQVGTPLERAINDLLHQHRAGDDLILTIDARLQAAAATALGNHRGAVLALDPHTGAILALASAPSYDPATIDELGDTLLQDPDRPLLNRATQGLYPPGSTFKVVTAAAGLDTGTVKPSDRYRCLNGVVIQGFVVQCTNAPPGQTEWDFLHAFAFSINATFAQVAANQLGSDLFLNYSRRFGLDQSQPLEIDVATSRTSRSGGSLDPTLLANSGFGQGQLQVTPLQMALVAATVANGGALPLPYLVREVRAPGGGVVQQHSPESRRQVISAATATELTRFMVTAVDEGFGEAAGLLGRGIAGKTGTAETGGSAAPDSWFIGFAPADNPAIAIAVLVENGGPGSAVAAPIAGALFQTYLGR